ncbi:MAG: hypothetical protein NWF07_01425, partial [Candidatus Bathyarchaeota archaeon]|nr:hypothetical protein [Candidatus Bathyarchaeota archaeon]
MKRILKLGLLVLTIALFSMGFVSAESKWAIGQEVQLIVTTTNNGDVNVIQSTGTITIGSPG